jgi:hypothetical protein
MTNLGYVAGAFGYPIFQHNCLNNDLISKHYFGLKEACALIWNLTWISDRFSLEINLKYLFRKTLSSLNLKMELMSLHKLGSYTSYSSLRPSDCSYVTVGMILVVLITFQKS